MSLYGRLLGVREIRRMELAERTVNAYRSFHESKDWAKWQKQNPTEFQFLTYAIKLYESK